MPACTAPTQVLHCLCWHDCSRNGYLVLAWTRQAAITACIMDWHDWLDAMTVGCADGLLSVDDPQFHSSFTDVYNADSLQV